MAGTADVVVVGAGVIGLTTAVHFAENGLLVEVRSATPVTGTASAAAGAMWTLSLVDECAEVLSWGGDTLRRLTELAGHRGTGVRLVGGIEASRDRRPPSASTALLPGTEECAPAELPAGFATGSRFEVPLIDMPVYLDHLCGRLRDAGGSLRIEPVASLEEVLRATDVVVNCAGTGAGGLAADTALSPVRGQIVVVENPGIDEFFAEDNSGDELLYILPHGDRVVLGGTADVGEWDLVPDPVRASSIIGRCVRIEPALAAAAVLEHRVGLRPARAQVRCEITRREDGRWLGHSYGHGGAGVSLSWGCAHELFEGLKASW